MSAVILLSACETCFRDRDCDRWVDLVVDAPLRAADHGVAVGLGGALAVAVDDDDREFPHFRFELRDSGTDVDLHAVVAGSEPCPAIAVGDRGTIRLGGDGDTTWRAPTAPEITAALRAVATRCPLSSVAVGDGGTVLVAREYGESWELRDSGTTRTLRAVAMFDSFVVAAGDGGTVVRSVDGGDTWTSLAVGTTVDLVGTGLLSMSLTGPIHVWIGAADGSLVTSEDDGATWQVRDIGLTEPVRQLRVERHSFGNAHLPVNILGERTLYTWDAGLERLVPGYTFREPIVTYAWTGSPRQSSELAVFVDGRARVYEPCRDCL